MNCVTRVCEVGGGHDPFLRYCEVKTIHILVNKTEKVRLSRVHPHEGYQLHTPVVKEVVRVNFIVKPLRGDCQWCARQTMAQRTATTSVSQRGMGVRWKYRRPPDRASDNQVAGTIEGPELSLHDVGIKARRSSP